ncbi:ABC transporter ATP-binding protein [Herbaspirillum chlorophenolicum]|uniref:ABC transporter ATP-binding protein n=1 Tax=Herbaspirillum chlorophenolicum TaxID=211589 RepID=UPI000A518A38
MRLQASGVTAHYGDFQALFGVDFTVEAGQVVALIGANGAGKSTLLRTLAGLSRASTGAIHVNGKSITALPSHKVVGCGIALVPEGRRLLPSLSVEENLLLGAECRRAGPWNLARLYDLFPILKERRRQPATTLSGGQQQMVAIGRGLMSNPDVLLCDEISLGLSPAVVKDIYAALPAILADGMSMVVVEQDLRQALAVAGHVVCLQEGRVSLQGSPADLSHDRISQAYFGI